MKETTTDSVRDRDITENGKEKSKETYRKSEIRSLYLRE